MSNEGYSNYRDTFVDNLAKMIKSYPDLTVGQILHSIKVHHKRDTGDSLIDASDSDLYRAVGIAIRREQGEQEVGEAGIREWAKKVTK